MEINDLEDALQYLEDCNMIDGLFNIQTVDHHNYNYDINEEY